MGKNKNKGQGGSPSTASANGTGQKVVHKQKPAESTPNAPILKEEVSSFEACTPKSPAIPSAPPPTPETPKVDESQKLTENTKNSHGSSEEMNREEILAARKAKSALKAEKASKAAAKKIADAAEKADACASTPVAAAEAKQQQQQKEDAAAHPGSELNREEILEARKLKAIQQRAEKAAKSNKTKLEHKPHTEKKEEKKTKSNLKQGPSSSTDIVKAVRFGVTRSESEENLMKAMMHAEHSNVKIEMALRDMRDLLHPAFHAFVDRCDKGDKGDCPGPDELCVVFVDCVMQFIRLFAEEYTKMWPDADSLGMMMEESLKAQLNHLTQGDRYPLPYALCNIIRQIRKEMVKLGVADEKGKVLSTSDLLDWISDSGQQYFSLSSLAISHHLKEKITAATKIVTFDWCPVVNRVLLDTKEDRTLKKLCVLDAVKNGPGMRHLTSLDDHDGYVEYGDLTAAGSVFERGSLVLLGCSAVLSSGKVCLPRGAFQLCLLARASNVPVLILAPTYKFVDKAQAANRFALLGKTQLDILPPDLITAIVTDIRLLPPSSAPAVLKAKAFDDAN